MLDVAQKDARLAAMRDAANDELFLADLNTTRKILNTPISTSSLHERRTLERGRANLDPIVGSEQGMTRPVLVITSRP